MGALILSLIYIIPVLVLRAGINRRQGNRRMNERRVSTQVVSIDRRRSQYDRRLLNRRG